MLGKVLLLSAISWYLLTYVAYKELVESLPNLLAFA